MFEAPGLAAPLARPVWTAAVHPPVLPAEACATGPEADMLDLDQVGVMALVVRRTGGGEHLLISDGLRTIRVDVVLGSLNRRARLRFLIGGIASAGRPLLTLRRLIAFCKSGRFSQPLHPPEARARRWILLLRTIDALGAGADQRDVAEALLSGEAAELRWRSNTPSLRSQAQRLVRGARHMGGGGYRELLR